MSTAVAKLITIAEFMRMPDPPDGSKQELVGGEIVTMPPPHFNHGEAQLRLGALILAFARKHKLGRVTTESGLVTEHDPDSVRGPDIAFWSSDKVALTEKIEGYPEVSADLCVEIISESVRRRLLKAKLKEYFACGVRMVWVVDTETHTVTVYRSPLQGKLLSEEAELDGEDILPGFRCNVSEIFES